MRLRYLAPVVALMAFPSAALGQTGGAVAPSDLTLSSFAIAPATIGSAPVKITFRVDGEAPRARIRVDFVPVGAPSAVFTKRLGWKTVGVRKVVSWSLPAGTLPAGSYVARFHAVDDAGRVLRRTASASGKLPVRVVVPPPPATLPGIFPVQGTYSFGDEGARFGAQRNGHIHQGQDVIAAEGTPLVSPVAGVVFWRAVQKGGAGHYLVVRGDDGRDYVFMHLVAGSETVAKGDRVAAGQSIGQVGHTGDAEGPHLHFEIWPSGWYAKGSEPIDPLPDLRAWGSVS